MFEDVKINFHLKPERRRIDALKLAIYTAQRKGNATDPGMIFSAMYGATQDERFARLADQQPLVPSFHGGNHA